MGSLTLFGQVFLLHHVQHLFRDRHVLDTVAADVNFHHLDELVCILPGKRPEQKYARWRSSNTCGMHMVMTGIGKFPLRRHRKSTREVHGHTSVQDKLGALLIKSSSKVV